MRWMNGYIRVGVLPKEDVCPEKFGGKQQSVFKVNIVVPAGILLVVVCFVGQWTPCAVQQEETVVPHPGSSWNQRCCHVTFLVVFWPEKESNYHSTFARILCHVSLSVDSVIKQPISNWGPCCTALDYILLS